MSAVPCQDCIGEGVDCPLVIDGQCIHCGRPDAPVVRRVGDAAFRRLTTDSLLRRPRATRATFRVRAMASRLLGHNR